MRVIRHQRHVASGCTAVAVVLMMCGVVSAATDGGGALMSAAALDTAPGDQRPQRIKAFMTWATDNGVTVATGLTVQPFEESGYHVITTAEVSTNQTLFAVPVDVAVRVDSQHTDFGSVFAAELEAGWWTPEMAGAADELHVVALVLYERFYVPRSFWQPYWDICPTNFDFLPPYFSDDELQLAQVSSLLTSKLKYFDSMREKWGSATLALAYSRPDVFGARSRANDALLRRRVDWAVNAVLTRAYEPRFEGDRAVMVPLSDLLNHAPFHRSLSHAEQRTDDGQGRAVARRLSAYVQQAHERVPVGSELFASYSAGGYDCNAVHLAHYGFTVPGEGGCDCAYIELAIGINPAMWVHRDHDIALLHAAGMVGPNGRVGIQPRADFNFAEVVRAVFPALRATVLHKVDEPMTEELVQQLHGMVTIESEVRVCRKWLHLLKGVTAQREAQLGDAWARVMARRGNVAPTVAMRHIRHVIDGSVRVFRRLVTALEEYWATLLHAPGP